MDPKDIAKQVTQFTKTTFENTFDAITVLQEQTEKLIGMYLDQVPLLPEEVKKAIADWMNAYKKGREEFKGAVEENYNKVENFFASYDKGVKSETIKEPKTVKARPPKKSRKKK